MEKKPIYKRVWFWILIALFAFVVSGLASGGDDTASAPEKNTSETSQPAKDSAETSDESAEAEEQSKEPDVPIEYQSALTKAQIYCDTMYMSKAGLFEQLTSEYGEQFSEEAAEYALEHVDADYKANALEKAKTYQIDMAMSPDAVYDQLVSEYGEQFTEEEAAYAIEHLEK